VCFRFPLVMIISDARETQWSECPPVDVGQTLDSFRLDGKTAIILGAASGIGASITDEMLRAGAAVVAVDISPTVERLVDRPGVPPLQTLCADVTEASTIVRALTMARDLRAQATILVHSAFTESVTGLHETPEAAWHRTLDVLLTSAWKCGVSFVNDLNGQEASIVHIASVLAFATGPKYGAYATAKAGLLGLTRSAAVEWGPLGVRVNAICPGFVKVERNAFVWQDPGAMATMLRCYPLRRPGLPSDIAQAVRFLASPAASFINGVALPVDGGMLALIPEAVAFER
jgi:NAD(P)-dependent dehydrogenase (short-subunit alcohol dehydrogenase family)